MNSRIPLCLFLLVLMLAGCSGEASPTYSPTSADISSQASQIIQPQETEVALPTSSAEPTQSASVPIEVTYFTPSQAEGPYYPVEKPKDRDNDLTDFIGADGNPEGEVVEFSGVVYDANGNPASGVVIEIWQTIA